LIGAGYLGLLRAIDGYDPGRGYAFSTYAVPWIRCLISRDVKRWKCGTLRQHEVQRRFKKAKGEFFEAFNQTPTDDELIDWAGLTREDLQRARNQKRIKKTIGLDKTIWSAVGQFGTLIDLVEAESHDPMDEANYNELIKVIYDTLPCTLWEIFRMRFLEKRTLQDIADQTEDCRETIRKKQVIITRLLRSRLKVSGFVAA